ncbi:transglutaminase-like domain-containing protein [Murimonas intestini]|uniref:transglutaminase-like domain-containing protein n=1 Tax=Murimonas intestini TaxID=1337051 RepID=UPI0011DE4778|nr:transglutaminase-like domain-containing protein [Murimonas intestini]
MVLFICYLAGIFGTVFSFLEAFPVPYNASFLYAGILFFSLLLGLIYIGKKYLKLTLPFTMAVYIWAMYLNFEKISSGAYILVDVIRMEIRNYLYVEENIMTGTQTESMEVTMVLLFVMFVFAIFLFYGTVARGSRFIAVASTAIPAVGGLAIGKVPSLFTLCLLGLCYLGAFTAGGLKYGSMGGGQDWEEEEKYISRVRQKSVLFIGAGAIIIFAVSYYLMAPALGAFLGDKAEARQAIQDTDLLTWARGLLPEAKKQDGGRVITSGNLPEEKHPGFTGETALRVTTDVIPQNVVYLKGFTGAEYTGSTWKPLSEDVYQSDPYDRAEAIENYVGESWENELTIKREQASRGGYAPYFSRKLSNGGSDAEFFLYFQRRDFEEIILRGQEMGLSPAWDSSDYQQYVYENYLSYPADRLSRLEQQCRENPQESIAGVRDYIISYLTGTCAYNLQSGDLPAGEDFTEYFLYERREGYCVHFATAAVLMFRMYGVPARYATGYAVPAGEFYENGGNYMAEVPDSMAHSWAEIYLDGTGWVPVEATPGYGIQSEAASPFETIAPGEMQTEMQPAGQTDSQGNLQTEDQGKNKASETAGRSQETSGNRTGSGSVWGVLGGLVFTAVFIFLLAAGIFVRRAVIIERRRKKDVAGIFSDVLKVLTEAGLPGETDCLAQDFVSKVHDQFKWLSEEELDKMVEMAMRANYGREKMTKEERLYMRSMYRYICVQTGKIMGRWGKIKLRFLKAYY